MRRLALLVACASLSVLLASGGVSAQTARAAPGFPTNLSATAVGGSLTVTWSAPTGDGGATITSYDLQYTEGDGTTPSWTVLDDVWTSGSLSYVVSGLRESTQYAVQVRAVNSDGDGDWSDPPVAQTTTDHGNSRTTATPAALGDDLPGTIDTPADEDYFSFTIDATTGTTDVWLYTTGDTDTHGHLYNSSGTQLAANNDSFHPNGLTNFEIRAVLNVGTYYLRVKGFTSSSSGPYMLHARAAQAPGESFSTATMITPTSDGALAPGRIPERFVSDDDPHENYFTFVLSSFADVFITSTGDRDTRVKLYDSAKMLLTENDDSRLTRPNEFLSIGREFLLREGLPAGTYYIVVTHYADDTGPYSVFIQTVPERGASRQEATEISLTSNRAGTIISPGGYNYFSFTLERPLWVVLATRSNRDVTLSFDLFDGSDQDLSYLLHNESTSDGSSALGYLTPGTYYPRVTSTGAANQRYVLQMITSLPQQAILRDCQERGESRTEVSGRPDDPLYDCQWHLHNFGQYEGGATGVDIRVEEAWATTMGAASMLRW